MKFVQNYSLTIRKYSKCTILMLFFTSAGTPEMRPVIFFIYRMIPMALLEVKGGPDHQGIKLNYCVVYISCFINKKNQYFGAHADIERD